MIFSPNFDPNLPKIVWRELLDAIFPPRCAGCGFWSKNLFCDACQAQIRPIQAPFCKICGHPFDPLAFAAGECADCRANSHHKNPPFQVARAAWTFEGPGRLAIHRLKYREKIALAAPLAHVLAEVLAGDAALKALAPRFLVPVPLHRVRHWQRGFNQSELLAHELTRLTQIPTAPLLRRTRATTPQVDLKAAERLKNVRGAFDLDATQWAKVGAAGQPILLVDDVFTTGATLRECASALRKAGSGPVGAITLARRA